ncbi:MAG TPA: phosphate ABC transporter substrate-binding protein [Nitrospiraceae bacterium]|nr:phosphate ABC transporter substrate-binding protein [Nitrospiraceae bacterium]
MKTPFTPERENAADNGCREDMMRKISILFGAVAVLGILVVGTTAQALELNWVGCGITKKAFMKEVSRAYTEKTGVVITLQGGGATRGIVDVAAGKADMGGSCRHVLMRPEERGVRLIPVGWDALAVITHKSNPVDSLTLEQIKNIFDGMIINWKQVGGPDRMIKVIAREGKISGVGRMARELVFKNPKKDFTSDAKLVKSSGPLEKMAEKTPWVVGFSGISSARKRNVKILKIEGKELSYQNIAAGQYLLFRPLYLVIKRGANQEVKNFVQFIMSQEGQNIIKGEGTVTLKDGSNLWRTYTAQMRDAGTTPGTF